MSASWSCAPDFPVDRPAVVVNRIVEEDGGTGEPALEMRIGELLDLGVRGEPAKRLGRQGEVDPGCRQAGGIPAPPFAHRSEQLIERMDLGHRAYPRRHGAQPVPRAGEAGGRRIHREEQETLIVLAKSRQGIALDVVDIQDLFVHLRGCHAAYLVARRLARRQPRGAWGRRRAGVPTVGCRAAGKALVLKRALAADQREQSDVDVLRELTAEADRIVADAQVAHDEPGVCRDLVDEVQPHAEGLSRSRRRAANELPEVGNRGAVPVDAVVAEARDVEGDGVAQADRVAVARQRVDLGADLGIAGAPVLTELARS